jgi:hypothetical protein
MSEIDFDRINREALSGGHRFLAELAPGGKLRGSEYTVLNPRRPDRKLGSFCINFRTGAWADFATDDRGGDVISWVAYLRGSSQSDAAREISNRLRIEPHKTTADSGPAAKVRSVRPVVAPIHTPATAGPSSPLGTLPARTPPSDNGRPTFFAGGDTGPRLSSDEIRRHIYRQDGVPVRIKIKRQDGSFVNWYRVADGDRQGWQSAKPDSYVDVPYRGAIDPFDAELLNDLIYWPEGERDVDTLGSAHVPAFTFGGTGDGLPDATRECIAGRHIVILADNDEPGRRHAEQKAALAFGASTSVRIVHFPELKEKHDVSDWMDLGHSADELESLAQQTPLWRFPAGPADQQPKPQRELVIPCASEIIPEPIERVWPGRLANGSDAQWADPDLSLLDDRRGQLPAFPIDALSPACRDWVKRAAHGAGVTPAHVAVPMIGIASSLIGTARRIQASRSFIEPVTSWTTIVGFSGTGKTPGINATRRALALVERNRKEEITEMRRAHETKRETAKAVREAWKKQLSEIAADRVVELNKYRSAATAESVMPQGAEDPGPFVAPRLHVSSATIERLAEILQVQPQGALLLSDELASLFLNMSRYSGGQDNEFWLEAWNGGPYTVERMSRHISIDYLLIGVVGGMQPDKLARSFKGDADGMSARFLFCWPPEPSYRPLTNDVLEIEPDIINALTRLVNLPAWQEKKDVSVIAGTLSEINREFVPQIISQFVPRTVPLSPLAVEKFERFRQFAHVGKAALDGRDREWWAKMPAHVLRLAGTLCFVDWAFVGGQEPTEVDENSMASAIQLVHSYFWPHARACLRQIGLSDRHKEARRVLRWTRAHGRTELSREDVRRDALAQALNAEETDDLLGFLVKAGWLRETVSHSGPKGGKPVRRWQVNPTLISTAETAETAESGSCAELAQ